MKKRKNQLRPEGSSDKKNCHHLANQPQGAQPASLSPEVWDHPHGLAEAAQPWDQAHGAGGGRGRAASPLAWWLGNAGGWLLTALGSCDIRSAMRPAEEGC